VGGKKGKGKKPRRAILRPRGLGRKGKHIRREKKKEEKRGAAAKGALHTAGMGESRRKPKFHRSSANGRERGKKKKRRVKKKKTHPLFPFLKGGGEWEKGEKRDAGRFREVPASRPEKRERKKDPGKKIRSAPMRSNVAKGGRKERRRKGGGGRETRLWKEGEVWGEVGRVPASECQLTEIQERKGKKP